MVNGSYHDGDTILSAVENRYYIVYTQQMCFKYKNSIVKIQETFL